MTTETFITIEPIPANPGYVAHITGYLADPERDPSGMGGTRLAAALDLVRNMQDLDEEVFHPCVCLAIAAVLREDRAAALPSEEVRFTYERAIALVEGIA